MLPEHMYSRLRLYFIYLFYEQIDLGMQPELLYPRRIRFAPFPYYLYLSVARSMSRCVSFFFKEARLS